MKLVDNWQQAWKWFSVQAIAVGGSIQLAVLAFPSELKGWLPDYATHVLAIGLLILAAGGRLVKQKSADA